MSGWGDPFATSARSRSPPRQRPDSGGGLRLADRIRQQDSGGGLLLPSFSINTSEPSQPSYTAQTFALEKGFVATALSQNHLNRAPGAKCCMRFLKGDCTQGDRCSNIHPQLEEEVVGWVSTFLARQCQNAYCTIPGCLYGHPEQKPGEAPPGGWSQSLDGKPPPAERVAPSLKAKWAKLTEDGALYTGDDVDPESLRERCERFNKANNIDLRAGLQLTQLPTAMQQRILAEGPIWGPNPSAGLMSRINKVSAQFKADGGVGGVPRMGAVKMPTTTITQEARHAAPKVISFDQKQPFMTEPEPGPGPDDGYLPPGLMEAAGRQLMGSMPDPQKKAQQLAARNAAAAAVQQRLGGGAPAQQRLGGIAISHVQLPGEAPRPVQSLSEALRAAEGSAPVASDWKRPAPVAAAPKPKLTWDQISRLSMTDLHRTIREVGAEIPPEANPEEKADLCAILRRALGVTS